MNQPHHTFAPIPSSTPDATISHGPRPQAKRARLERARSLVIAQFGGSVLINLERDQAPRAPALLSTPVNTEAKIHRRETRSRVPPQELKSPTRFQSGPERHEPDRHPQSRCDSD